MLLLISVASLLTAAQDAPPDLATVAPQLAAIPNTTLVGYPVAGRTPRALRSAITAGRPKLDGESFDARTTWRYATRWRSDRQGACDPSSAEVTYTITITLPQLTTRDRLSTREQANWDRYYAALVHHEGNHAGIAVAGAADMQAAMRASASCEAMEQASRAVSEAVSEASRTYDARTRHGRTEGATYP